jgi:hypothetical protein
MNFQFCLLFLSFYELLKICRAEGIKMAENRKLKKILLQIELKRVFHKKIENILDQAIYWFSIQKYSSILKFDIHGKYITVYSNIDFGTKS